MTRVSELARKLSGLRRQAGAGGVGGAAIGTSAATPAQALSTTAEASSAYRAEAANDTQHARLNAAPGASRRNDAAQLTRLRNLINLRSTPAPLRACSIDRALPGEEIAAGLRYVEHCVRADIPDWLPLDALGFPSARSADMLAFDTETTGLAGGTGTRAFMIGAADWHRGELRLRQLFITTLAAETRMLQEFSTWLDDDTVLVSYNGKSYDRPLLSTRLRLARLPDPLLNRTHIDLLHPMRRRYRGIWPNCKLATAERELLAVCREDDLPGAEAPAAWLTYLRGGSASKLRRVADHNAQDLRSLCGLLQWFSALPCIG